ncbi:uncharacterized protein METZ01_LOCUS82853 [marine metagenome]|uniref:Uncharacterized protein n=1 Tax=marine metagenome TaxID=408172 RepID=A0A381UPB8_9ZZZZ
MNVLKPLFFCFHKQLKGTKNSSNNFVFLYKDGVSFLAKQ